MENENKEKVVLNEEELKKVSGGATFVPVNCAHALKPENCEKVKYYCIWRGGKCVSKASL